MDSWVDRGGVAEMPRSRGMRLAVVLVLVQGTLAPSEVKFLIGCAAEFQIISILLLMVEECST